MLKLDRNYSDYTDETDEDYPEGKAIDASSSESFDGTPLLAAFMNDINGAHIAMYEKAFGSTDEVSGEPDTQKSSQFVDAIEKYVGDKDKNNFKFTYVVNSDESLAYWLSNKASGESSGGDDFTSVLIKAGEWSYDGSIVALDTIGTIAIEGEVGNKVNLTDGLRYNSLPKETEYYIRGVNLTLSLKTTEHGNSCLSKCFNISDCTIVFANDIYSAVVFKSCENITNCIAINNSSSFKSDCYLGCKNLINCTGKVQGNAGTINVYVNCVNLINCTGYAGGTNNNYIFKECENLNNCSGDLNNGTENYFFNKCKGLDNCNVKIIGWASTNKAQIFYFCDYLSNCDGSLEIAEQYPAVVTEYIYNTCHYLTNCKGYLKYNNYAGEQGARSQGSCFYTCGYLTNCEGTSEGLVGGAGVISNYSGCIHVHSCKSYIHYVPSAEGNYFGMINCEGVLGCLSQKVKEGQSSSGGSYEKCYSVYFFQSGKSDTFLCANTANGGFNS